MTASSNKVDISGFISPLFFLNADGSLPEKYDGRSSWTVWGNKKDGTNVYYDFSPSINGDKSVQYSLDQGRSWAKLDIRWDWSNRSA